MRLHWFLAARGLTLVRAILGVVVMLAGLAAATYGLAGGFHADTALADRALLAVLLAVVAVSLGLSFLLVTKASTIESTPARSLVAWRIGLGLMALLVLCWPLAISGWVGSWLALQCAATGWLLFGSAALVVVISRRWFAFGFALYVAASLLPGLLAREWNLLHPSRHGWPYLAVAAGFALVGLVAYGLAGPAKATSNA